mmetsp:Transcript_133947/g.317620  ORF Transcript_133947/g.317620 Transcript_133947/m.317620 type:complete len:253 (+) Transcript_133947:79-837(+)|eukprot:CAMPEP_0181435218 /NCGR_PEP_ID=MMETSP1110-20121109/20219_1 /TAXON_ID=174948 /ORGANISM="Symbiodinium sp., Strain CCMP421" /LENGTH=252 /DNA_ID=CAMNT_0023558745 /DNA_START=56 /DNA_END=814 /DNA_ORIENTATION=-
MAGSLFQILAVALAACAASSPVAETSHSHEAPASIIAAAPESTALMPAIPAHWLQVQMQETPVRIQIRLPSAGQVLGQMAVMAVIATAAALAFRRYVPWPELNEAAMDKEKLSAWSSGPFDCFEDMGVCCWTCFCPAARWAGNMDMAGLLSFWLAFGIFLSMLLLTQIPFAGLFSFVLMGILTYYRNKLRVAFGMAGANECPTVCGDCIFVTCCTCCAISQEARHVEMAARVNHQVVASQRPILTAPAQETA